MFPVMLLVEQFLMEIMYCLSTAVTTCCISACSTPRNSWKPRRFSLYTILSSHGSTRAELLGIFKIPGCTGPTYRTGDSVAYFVLIIKITRCPGVPHPSLEYTERPLIFSLI